MNTVAPEPSHQPPTPANCRNCGTPLGAPAGSYCPHCGQETSLHPPSAAEFLHEFVGHYVALEGKLWRTLGLLFFKPGSLTREYMAGRKQRYVLPLRLYLTASLLFFIIVKIVGVGDALKVNISDGAKAEITATQPVRRAAMSAPAIDAVKCDLANPACRKIRDHVAEKYKGKTVGDMSEHVYRRMVSAAPYAAFFLLPFFSLLTMGVYGRRRLLYGEHLVYAFHVHAFAFFAMLAMALLPAVSDWILLASFIYYLVAMQRFFGGRVWVNLLRYGAISILYTALIAAVILAALLIAFFY